MICGALDLIPGAFREPGIRDLEFTFGKNAHELYLFSRLEFFSRGLVDLLSLAGFQCRARAALGPGYPGIESRQLP
jgi:hypothetical protein